MAFTKSFLRHELQNILMMLGFHLEDAKLDDKEEALELIKLASLLVEHEKLFLGKKLEFFLQEVALSDIWEILLVTNEEIIHERKIQVKTNSKDEILKIDRDQIIKALNQVFMKILENAGFIELTYIKKERTLSFKHDAGLISELKESSLEEVFKAKKLKYHELILQTALAVLEDFGCKLEVQKNEIKINFPADLNR